MKLGVKIGSVVRCQHFCFLLFCHTLYRTLYKKDNIINQNVCVDERMSE